MKKIKVLIVDDSELIRQVLTEIISGTDDIEVIATAEDPIDARAKIKKYNPDVLTLDIEMPKMDGITFLKNLMRLRPMPVIMISTLTQIGAPATLDALEIGAVDYIGKPQGGSWGDLKGYADTIHEKIRNAAKANMAAHDKVVYKPATRLEKSPNYKRTKVICVGSSTGGTEAMREVLQSMPPNCPPILLAQHIPVAFSASLADRLNRHCDITVREAKSGMPLEKGNAYIAPGDLHLTLHKKDDRYITACFDGENVSGHKPSVDVLFKSVAKKVGRNAVSIILTGMGRDGAEGMRDIFNQGGVTIVQDEATSVVWGMPGAAAGLGVAQHVVPIKMIASEVLKHCKVT